MSRLIPDPPLGDFPALPEGLRWRIEKPDPDEGEDFRPLRRVHVERREVRKNWRGKETIVWTSVQWGVWAIDDGLGNFKYANPEQWHHAKGLAATMGHLLKELAKPATPTYDDVYGVSVL